MSVHIANTLEIKKDGRRSISSFSRLAIIFWSYAPVVSITTKAFISHTASF